MTEKGFYSMPPHDNLNDSATFIITLTDNYIISSYPALLMVAIDVVVVVMSYSLMYLYNAQ